MGRSLAYHYPSCDALMGCVGNEVYRLNLDQGRFLNSLVLSENVEGVNAIDVNPAHQLLAFGSGATSGGDGTVEFWDPRSRNRVGVLVMPGRQLAPVSVAAAKGDIGAKGVEVTALSSRSDGLSLAVGTSTGHTLLYDLRSPHHYAVKDQGYGLPMKKVIWVEGGAKMAGDGMVISADNKVIKVWDRNSVRQLASCLQTVTHSLSSPAFCQLCIHNAVFRHQSRPPRTFKRSYDVRE